MRRTSAMACTRQPSLKATATHNGYGQGVPTATFTEHTVQWLWSRRAHSDLCPVQPIRRTLVTVKLECNDVLRIGGKPYAVSGNLYRGVIQGKTTTTKTTKQNSYCAVDTTCTQRTQQGQPPLGMVHREHNKVSPR